MDSKLICRVAGGAGVNAYTSPGASVMELVLMDAEEIKQRVEKLAGEMVKLGAQEPVSVCLLSSLINLASILEVIRAARGTPEPELI